MRPGEVHLSSRDPLADSGPSFGASLTEYAAVVRNRWRLIGVVIALSVSFGLLHYFLTPKLYRAQVLLQIEQRSSLAVGTDRNPYLDAFLTQKYYPTQYRLLRSRGLAERVVDRLALQDDPRFSTRAAAGPDDEAVVAGMARRLLGGVSVKPVSGTELVTVDYVASDPDLAAETVNVLAEEYIRWNRENRSEEVDAASSFLRNEIRDLRQEIEDKEQKLAEYSRNSDIVTLDPASNLTLQRLERLNADLLSAQASRRAKQASLRELEALPRESVADKESGGLIAGMRRDQLQRQNDYDAKLLVYKPDWPEMVELKTAIDEGERAIGRETEKHYGEARRRGQAEYETALRQERSIERDISQVKSDAIDLNSVSVEFNNLKMEIVARRTRQDELLQELATADMSARMFNTDESNIRVIERALVPGSPFRPSLRIDVAIGLTAGALLGIGLALLLHFLDRTVKTPDELEQLLGLPLLGVIPDITKKAKSTPYYGYDRQRKKSATSGRNVEGANIELLPSLHPRLAVSEAYRSLRTALLLSSAEQLHLISVTSAESGEGKTATTSNLGVVLAQLGKRVLIVDADLRKPRIFKVFDVSNRTGLVHYLTGSADPASLCLPTEERGLFVCPAGPHPPNPSELLASERMDSFLEWASESFDFVIVDTPPVLAVTDAVLVGEKCQGTVLCFRSNKVERASVQACRSRLRVADVRVLGAVLNRYAPSRSGYGRRYDYYYDSYGEESKSSSAA